MKTDQLKKLIKNRRRSGRGISSGKGKTAGRGTKGQKSRSGYNIPTGFEGGQNPIKKRIPKLGGFNRESRPAQVVNLGEIYKHFKTGATVSPSTLEKKGLIRDKEQPVKVLAMGSDKSKKLKFSSDLSFSKSAKEASK